MKVHQILVGLCAVVVVAGPRPASAETDRRSAPTSLTLARARAIAAERAPRLRAARARTAIARGALAGVSIALPYNPQLSVGAGPRFGDQTTLEADVQLSQRIEIGGQRGARIDRGEAAVEKAAADAEDEARRLVLAVSDAFARVLRAEAALEVRTESASVAQALLTSVRRRHEVGDIGGLDVNVATSLFARAIADRERAAAERARSLGRLRGLLGFEPTEVVVVEGALDELPDFTLERLFERAEDRADLRALRSSMKRADAEVALGDAEGWPDLALSVRYGREEGADIAALGLGVFLPVFDRGQGTTAQGTARRQAAELDLEALRRAVRAELAGELEAYRHLRIAARSYARTALPTLSENLDRGREAYQGGAIPIGELLSIQRALVEARVTYVDLLFEASLAAFRIEAQAGGPVP